MSFAQTVADLARETEIPVSVVDDNTVLCDLDFTNGRSQRITILNGELSGDDTGVAHVFTPVLNLRENPSVVLANRLLRLSGNGRIGSLQLLKAEGLTWVVFAHRIQLMGLQPELFSTVVAWVGSAGDRFEEELGGADVF